MGGDKGPPDKVSPLLYEQYMHIIGQSLGRVSVQLKFLVNLFGF